MSNPVLVTLQTVFSALTGGIRPLKVEQVAGSNSSGTKRTKLSTRDFLATLSSRRISISEIQFIGESSRGGGAYGDVAVASLVKAGDIRDERRRVAVKKLRFVINGDMTQEKFLRVFVNELHVLEKLSHPNIVEIIGFVEDVEHRITWLIFPWEDNGNLREFLHSGEWEIPERVSLTLDVARGLEYLHTRQPPICHGDIKSVSLAPENAPNIRARIIRGANSATQPAASASHKASENNDSLQLKITTSEIALTLTGPACSLRWSPPEVLNGESLDLAADIWALGWVAWEAITDCYPFDEVEREWDVTMKIIEGQLPSIRDHTQLSQIYRLCNMMQRCWELEPRERPSVTECRQALELMPRAIPVVKGGKESKIRSATLLLQVGEMHRLQNRHEEASRAYHHGLTIARLAGDQTTVGNILLGLAANDRGQSKYAGAAVAYTEVLAIFDSIGDDLGRANALLGLGDVQPRLPVKYPEAEAMYTKALGIYESIGNNLGRANALHGLGDVQRAWYKYVDAEASYTQALGIYESIGDDLGRANSLLGLGHVQRAQSKYAEAETPYTRALAVYEGVGNDFGRGNALRGLGNVQRARSKYVEAEASYTKALGIFQSIRDDLGRANTLRELGYFQRERSKYVEASVSYTQALEIYERVGDSVGQVNASYRLGQIMLHQARYAEAKTFSTDASVISEQIDYAWGKRSSKRLLEKVLEAERLSTGLPPTS